MKIVGIAAAATNKQVRGISTSFQLFLSNRLQAACVPAVPPACNVSGGATWGATTTRAGEKKIGHFFFFLCFLQ
jgi:hypothetical protein